MVFTHALGEQCEGIAFGLFLYLSVCLSICLSVCARNSKTIAPIDFLHFFTHKVSYPWLGPPLRIELIKIQCSAGLKTAFKEVSILEFYRTHIPEDQHPVLMNHGQSI